MKPEHQKFFDPEKLQSIVVKNSDFSSVQQLGTFSTICTNTFTNI